MILISCSISYLQIQAAFRTDEIRRAPPTPQDEMRAGMSYFHETIWKGVPKFLRRVDTALKNIGINERLPYNAPIIQFSSWMGGDRDGAWHSLSFFLDSIFDDVPNHATVVHKKEVHI
jgi:phosphoenolpyruvate carboxylase